MAREALMYPPVVLNGEQIAAIGRGVTREVEQFAGARVHALRSCRIIFILCAARAGTTCGDSRDDSKARGLAADRCGDSSAGGLSRCAGECSFPVGFETVGGVPVRR